MELGRVQEEKAQKEKEQDGIVVMRAFRQAGCPTINGAAISYAGDGQYRPPTEFKLKSLLRSRKKF